MPRPSVLTCLGQVLNSVTSTEIPNPGQTGPVTLVTLSESRHLGCSRVLQLYPALNKTSMVSGSVLSLRIRETDPGPSTSVRVIPVKGQRMPKEMSLHSEQDRHRPGLLPSASQALMRTLGCHLLEGAEPQRKDVKAPFEARHNP